ncbi:MAG TPA: iron ABC transporter permease [Polyangiaceae bacterium]|nr:iron ABC transporter permease [Polyangiaceae bacterium]
MRVGAGTIVATAAVSLLLAIVLGVSFGSGSAWFADLFVSGTVRHDIVVGFRLPRVLLGAVAGAGLAAVGASFQAVLRNPLAEPYVLGVSGGAALGATVAIVLGGSLLVGVLGAAGVPAAAFAGGLAATAIVWTLVRAGRASGASILLAGVVVNAIAGACITLVEAIAEPGQAQSLLWWLMGFLDVPSWPELAFVALYVALGLALLVRDAPRMNLMALGDEPATTLGLDVRALERRVFFACAAVVGAIVSVTGLIGFVGLVVPQAIRRLTGPDLRVVLPASALAGGAVLTLCDLLVRVLAPHVHTELPVGAVTALAGGPVFLLLLRRSAHIAPV